MELNYPLCGQNWQKNLNARRYGFLLCDNPISLPHFHSFFELGYVIKGEMDHNFLGSITHLVPGDFFFVDIHTTHSYQATPDIQLLNFMFFPENLDTAQKDMTSLSAIAGSPTFRFDGGAIPLLNQPSFHDEDGSFFKHLEQLQHEIQEKKPGHHQMEHTLILQLVIRLMRLNYTAQSSVYDQPLVQKILPLLDAEYADDLSLKSISGKLGYSPAYISRVFKKYFDTTFTEYLQRLRLGKSCGLLLETDWSISEVAAAVGYNNVQFYHRLFKKYYSMTPLQYRKRRKLY